MTADRSPLSPKDLASIANSLRTERVTLLMVAREFAGPFLPYDMCEDVTQSAMLHLWKTAGRYRPELDPKRTPLDRYFESAYAHTTVRNHALTAIRAAKRRAKRLAEAPEDVEAIAAPRVPDPIEVEERRKALAKVIKLLDSRAAAIVTAVLLAPGAPLEEQRVKAEMLFGQPIPREVFSNAKTGNGNMKRDPVAL